MVRYPGKQIKWTNGRDVTKNTSGLHFYWYGGVANKKKTQTNQNSRIWVAWDDLTVDGLWKGLSTDFYG